MVGKIKNNKHLINAPAGSGKTTYIRNKLKSICFNKPGSRILCITYTNRAADELKKDLESTNITVSTIHSYINDLISPFYSHKEVLDLYWEIYAEKINERIQNVTNDENINKSNQYYIEKYGELTEKTVHENLLELSYGETQFTSFYTGKLSHDDLLMFANKLIKRYPILLRKIGDKYNYIFIDEYQDTSAYVLDIFNDAVENRENIQLYLFGDRMQQIYKNYDGSFEEKWKEFDTSDRLETNFRSIGKIVSILNNIYNDSSFKQHPTESNIDVVPDIMPKLIISPNVQECICELQKKFPDILTLYLMNKEKYQEIGAKNLYSAYESMEKYSFGRKYSPTDILSDMSNDNPDILMKFLFLLNSIMSFYANENYGMVISLCKKESRYFDSQQFKIKKHTDKKRIKNKFDKIQAEYEKDECLIRDVIESLFNNGFIPEAVKNDFEESTEYQRVLDTRVIEVKNLVNYLNTPHISTQHGVKGESHPSVIFMASDNNVTPNVRMYPFFELWSKLDFSLPQFETLFYSYGRIIEKVEAELGMKIRELTAETHNKSEKNKDILSKYSEEVLKIYQGDILFNTLCKDDFVSYLTKQNVGNAKKIFKISKVEGILTAYKLFYVGCSRARKNLIIVVNANKVNGFKEAFINKMEKIGFSVLCRQ
jgi:DNA helicase-2/ATP-dependent DNA helicase PcrA